jgi:aminoglycoside phosphotransferase (APT) family kinase protein
VVSRAAREPLHFEGMTWTETLSDYVRARLPGATRVDLVNFGRMPAGASNETIRFDLVWEDGAGRQFVPLILRPQRSTGILEPYDVARQYRVMAGLAASSVPVPRMYWLEEDPAVLGMPFYVMERVEGFSMPLMWYGGGASEPVFENYARALALVHQVDWQGCGLAFLDPGGATPVEGELLDWRGRAARFGIDQQPLLQAMDGWLRENQPAQQAKSLLHGDCNPGNYIFREERVAAVVDWELATLGDPRSDLGFYGGLLAIFGGYWGAPGESRLAVAYQRALGKELAELPFFEALGLYKMAVILAGWQHGGLWASPWGWGAIEQRMAEIAGPSWAGAR